MTAETRSPSVLLIHGFGRNATQLFGWRDRIPGLGFVHLPGHSGPATLDEVSVEAWTEGFTEFMSIFPHPPLVIAESLGAVIAMRIPKAALIAIDPLLSTDQLWPIHQLLRNARARGDASIGAFDTMFRESFATGLDQIRAPTLVLAGNVPLMPPRHLATAPSVLTDADFAAYAAHPLVEARRIPGGHVLLDENPDGVMAAASDFMDRHGYPSRHA